MEKRIEEILIKNNIIFESQKWVGRYPFDFAFGNNILEIQGTFWHCDKRVYKENDMIKRNGEMLLCSDIWAKDDRKKNILIKYGYKPHYLWENDIKTMSDDEILDYIKKITG